MANYANHSSQYTQDNWYELYENYQLTITNYKHLPRVTTISLLNDSEVYALVDYEEGEPLSTVKKLTKDELYQLLAAIRHLHSKKFVHGAITPENIWLTKHGKVILYGAGELRALGVGLNQQYSADVQQLVNIIQDFAYLSEADLEKLALERPTAMGELETILNDATEVNEREVVNETGGLVEKETKEKPQAPTVKEEPKPKPKPQPKPTVNTTRQQENTDHRRKEHVERTRSQVKKGNSPFKKVGIALLAIIALIFVYNRFISPDDRPEDQINIPTIDQTASVTDEETQEPAAIEGEPEADEEEIPHLTEAQLQQFMDQYVSASVTAINARDFSIVKPYIDPNGESYQETADYINYLDSKGITERNLYLSVRDFVRVDPTTYKVTTREEYESSYEDGSIKVKTFNSSYILKILDGNYLAVNELLYTNEIASETIQEAYTVESGENDYTSLPDFYNDYLNASSDERGAVESAVRLHYGSISNDDFTTAYNQFSSKRKGKVSKEGWEKGLQANIYDEITYIDVTEVNDNRATVYVEMTSYDDNQDGTILVQDWAGHWTLVKENGEWKLDDSKIKNVGSGVESR